MMDVQQAVIELKKHIKNLRGCRAHSKAHWRNELKKLAETVPDERAYTRILFTYATEISFNDQWQDVLATLERVHKQEWQKTPRYATTWETKTIAELHKNVVS